VTEDSPILNRKPTQSHMLEVYGRAALSQPRRLCPSCCMARNNHRFDDWTDFMPML
jgi:hypothetical protein